MLPLESPLCASSFNMQAIYYIQIVQLLNIHMGAIIIFYDISRATNINYIDMIPHISNSYILLHEYIIIKYDIT